ncbi:PilZ domain-containing protein [Sphingomonas sp. IC081]|uniref:PilZ domain-containing protein n=1 Tax=Sphingomonas sp. IC081 TaxID=304378 RepID=UPI001158A201|nr:PilZ domain-containing protein [Sphingomonas sp. IC081]QDK31386.1 PilZ domain-containing protein [Sphingomonas sp. IC081]
MSLPPSPRSERAVDAFLDEFEFSAEGGADEPLRGLQPRAPRVTTILLIGKLAAQDRETLCRVRNISATGMMAEVHGSFIVEEAVEVTLKAGDTLSGTVRWNRAGRIGVAFDHPVDVPELLAHAAMRSGAEGVARGPRFTADCPAALLVTGYRHPARLVDISQGGARLTVANAMPRDQLLGISIPGLGEREAAVRWVGNNACGLVFLEPIAFADLGPWLIDTRARFANQV